MELAKEQLARVQVAWLDPVDWSDLALYGFYAVENAVTACADHFGVPWTRTHPRKVAAARILAEQHGLPDVSALLEELNSLRKDEAYGEAPPDLDRDPEAIAVEIERFVEAAAAILDNLP
jgi:hypothetical protein